MPAVYMALGLVAPSLAGSPVWPTGSRPTQLAAPDTREVIFYWVSAPSE